MIRVVATSIITTVICLARAAPVVVGGLTVSPASTLAGWSPETDNTRRFILLPEPQQVNYSSGTYKLTPERFIFLDMDSPLDRLNVGRIIQQSLAQVGPTWQLTAAKASVGRAKVRQLGSAVKGVVERTFARQPGIGATVRIDASQVSQRQGYQLFINENQIRIVAHDTAGAFYAAQTLRQICRQRAGIGQLPCIEIRDWPDFPNRGVLLDISRDKVPEMHTLYGLVDLLCEWKINQLQLYTEHTFAYRNHKVVWEHASPMTGEQIMALDAYCRERFVELVPNQSSFAHLDRWLKHKEYLHLAEREDYPFSLSPAVPGSIQLIAELYDELLPHFSSRQFNVNCDETFDLGSGKSKEICERLGKGKVYLDFLLKIHRQVQKHSRTMQFWGDIILRSPELITELPDGVVAMVWGYEADHPFAEQCPKFAASGVPFYVCPGTSSWNSIAGRTENAIGNLANAAENGLAHGAIGYLNTDWGDNGHWQPLPACYPGYAYGAAVSWATKTNKNCDLAAVLNHHAFKDKAAVMGKIVCDLGNAYKEPGVLLGNQSILFYILQNPDCSIHTGPYANLTVERLKKTRDYIEDVIQPLPKARMGRQDAGQVADEVSNAARLLRHACSFAIARLQTPVERMTDNGRRSPVCCLLSSVVRLLSSVFWLLRNREVG